MLVNISVDTMTSTGFVDETDILNASVSDVYALSHHCDSHNVRRTFVNSAPPRTKLRSATRTYVT